jgi:long-subunit acyl-CoA synthetase (AMP-forming)
MCSFIAGVIKIEIYELMKKGELVHLSYLPLPHVLERVVTWMLIFTGGQIYYFGGGIL